MPQRTAWFLPRVQRGGWGTIPAQGGATPHSAICLILLWLSFVNRTPLCRTGEKEGDESDPPQSGGGMWTRIAGIWGMPLSGPMRVALVCIYPCGKARNQPPRRGAERRKTGL